MFLCCTTNCLSITSAAVIKATDVVELFQLGLVAKCGHIL